MLNYKNKVIKIFATISIIILYINLLSPVVYAYTLNNEESQYANYENEFESELDNENTLYNESEEDLLDNENVLYDENNNTSQNESNLNNENTLDSKNELEIENELVESYNLEEDTEGNEGNEEFSINVDVSGYRINSYLSNNIHYLFMPQGVDISNLIINYTGKITQISSGTIDTENKTITNNFTKSNTITITANDNAYTVTVLQTDLPSVSISLNGVTLNQINSGSKDTKYKGNSLILKTASTTKYDFTDPDVEIKGRGNFSWTLPKKCYQFKLSSKVNVLGMGKSKTWLLIANYGDNSLMRNKLTYDLADEIGMPYTQNSQWIDLWVDGEYQGNYLLVEKVQVNTNRVELEDNYGVVVEMDNNYYANEDYYFKSDISGSHFVLHDSVAEDKDLDSIYYETAFTEFKNYINKLEKLLYSENKDWNEISSMIDVESFVKYYFIQEFTENADGARTSVFMYKDGANDVLHMGPVWDFDLALANCDKDNWGGNPEYDYIMNIKEYMESSVDWYTQLFTIPEFRQEVAKIYNNEIKSVLSTATQKISNYESQLTISSNMNFIRWETLGKDNAFGSYRGHKIKDTYTEEVKYLSDWVNKRVEYIDKRYGSESSICNIKYTSHVEDYGWDNRYYKNGELSGTEGQSKRLEAIRINFDTFNNQLLENTNIKYQVHVQDYGWMNWKQNGAMAGTEGQNKRIEAIKIQLENAQNYSVQYRVHVQDIGWTNWISDGEIAGTIGRSLRIEAIQIRLIEIPENTVTYTTHVQNVGWQSNVINGELSGTTGQSLRLEGIKINLKNKLENSHIKYSTHIQDIGWQDWKYDGELSGTEGQSKRLEAIKIELEGAEGYNIKYRVHVQNIGWTDWKANGELAGTTGQSLRLEGIQIKIEKN
ncbi:MAG: CotH kinase family protein [Clostridia bacterium]|nr:CotH kinase family protein [Clostridia bacterium]